MTTSSCWSQLTLQVTVSLELGYPAQLARPAPTSRDNTSVELCDPALCTGRDYSLDLEFDSSPEPSSLEWVIRWVPGSSSGQVRHLCTRSNDRRDSVTLREGERRRGYRVAQLRSARDSRHPDRCGA